MLSCEKVQELLPGSADRREGDRTTCASTSRRATACRAGTRRSGTRDRCDSRGPRRARPVAVPGGRRRRGGARRRRAWSRRVARGATSPSRSLRPPRSSSSCCCRGCRTAEAMGVVDATAARTKGGAGSWPSGRVGHRTSLGGRGREVAGLELALLESPHRAARSRRDGLQDMARGAPDGSVRHASIPAAGRGGQPPLRLGRRGRSAGRAHAHDGDAALRRGRLLPGSSVCSTRSAGRSTRCTNGEIVVGDKRWSTTPGTMQGEITVGSPGRGRRRGARSRAREHGLLGHAAARGAAGVRARPPPVRDPGRRRLPVPERRDDPDRGSSRAGPRPDPRARLRPGRRGAGRTRAPVDGEARAARPPRSGCSSRGQQPTQVVRPPRSRAWPEGGYVPTGAEVLLGTRTASSTSRSGTARCAWSSASTRGTPARSPCCPTCRCSASSSTGAAASWSRGPSTSASPRCTCSRSSA